MPSLPLRRRLFAGLLLTILALSVMPTPPRLPGTLGYDKLQHLSAFALLALSARGAWPRAAWRWIWLGLLAYGVGIELAQSLTPNRMAEVEDVGADLLGVGLAHLAWQGWRSRKNARGALPEAD